MSELLPQIIKNEKSEPRLFRKSQLSQSGYKNEVVFNYQAIEPTKNPQNCSIYIGRFLSNRMIVTTAAVFIVTYTILVTIRIAFDTETSSWSTELDILELVYLSIFIIEVILRVAAYRKAYLTSVWSYFDIIILTICLIIIISCLSSSTIANSPIFKVGKVLQIFRLFLMFRKVNAIYSFKDKVIKKRNAVVNLTLPSEKVIEILNSLLDTDWITYQASLKNDIEWCIYIIKEQKIYQTNIRAANEELKDLVDWASNQNQYEENESPAKSETFIKILSLDTYGVEVENILTDLHLWTFDIFELENQSSFKSLEIITGCLFKIYDLYQSQNIEALKFLNFIKTIQSGYRKENYYHNSTHAADVVQSFYFFLSTCNAIVICQLSDADIASCFISAAIHDYDHPGVNNLFLINTSHNLAVTYNDKSVLENYHISASFKIVSEEKNNFLYKFSKEEKKKYRYKIISLVLATDFARHFSDLGKFQLKFSNGSVKDEDDKLLAMETIMHASDIGNPSRPWKLCYEWASRVMNEFFSQGDKEREMGLPISNLCDRTIVSIPKSQIGFTELFIEPTFNAIEYLLPKVIENINNITRNKELWKEIIDNKN